MTLCGCVSLGRMRGYKFKTNHFEGPDPSNPHFQFSFNASHVIQLHTLPPATSGGFPPEKKKLLRHSNRVAVGQVVSFDVSPETCKRNAADDGLVGLARAVTPSVVVVESTIGMVRIVATRMKPATHPAVNISMRCCSVVPGSSLLRSPEKIPSCFRSASPAARFTSIISGWEMSRCGGIA